MTFLSLRAAVGFMAFSVLVAPAIAQSRPHVPEQPVVTPVSINVTFDLGLANRIFNDDQERGLAISRLASVAQERCRERFLKVYRFDTGSSADPSLPNLKFHLERDAGWSLCATIITDGNASGSEWPLTIVDPGNYLPPKADLLKNLERDIATLLKQHDANMRTALRRCTPIGKGGAIHPNPVQQVQRAFAHLYLNAADFSEMCNLTFRIEGRCGGTKAPMVLLSKLGIPDDVPAFSGGVCARDFRIEQEGVLVDVGPKHVGCLTGFEVGWIYLAGEPVQLTRVRPDAPAPQMIPPTFDH